MKTSTLLLEILARFCAIGLLLLILYNCAQEIAFTDYYNQPEAALRGEDLLDRPCEEFYVVGKGETIYSIIEKCNDPYIMERNPHINHPDDVVPGLVIKVDPFEWNNRNWLE